MSGPTDLEVSSGDLQPRDRRGDRDAAGDVGDALNFWDREADSMVFVGAIVIGLAVLAISVRSTSAALRGPAAGRVA